MNTYFPSNYASYKMHIVNVLDKKDNKIKTLSVRCSNKCPICSLIRPKGYKRLILKIMSWFKL